MKTTHDPVPSRAVVLVATALLCLVPSLLFAEEPLSTTTERLDETADRQPNANAALATKFTAFAGSEANATALVTGLHDGSTVTLTTTAADGTVTTTEFKPATSKLGYGNAFISLALARSSLAKAGITEPTSAQIVTALNGGTVTASNGDPVTLAGVLTLRAAGQGWGDIARSMNLKLGPVVRELHATHQHMANHEGNRPDAAARAERGAGKPERVDRPERTGRPDWAGHSGMPNPGQMNRAGKP